MIFHAKKETQINQHKGNSIDVICNIPFFDELKKESGKEVDCSVIREGQAQSVLTDGPCHLHLTIRLNLAVDDNQPLSKK